MRSKRTLPCCLVLLVGTIFSAGCSRKKDASVPALTLTEQLKAVTDSVVAHTYVPGIVALVSDSIHGIDWIYAAGVSNISSALPMNPDYTFRIGSVTKTFTGTVLLQLVDEGKIALEDKLYRFFPAYPKSDSITIAMLCNMSSGIFDVLNYDPWIQSNFDASKVWDPRQIIEDAFSYGFYFSPGTGWHYSNTNTLILGLIIEKITGNTLEAEINNRIVQPLHLANTGLITTGKTLPGSHGRGYYNGDYSPGLDCTEPYDLSMVWAAGSGYSTPRELQKYAEALIDGRFLSEALQQRRLHDMIPQNDHEAYGLCLRRKGTFYGHNGAIAGFSTSMYHSADKNCTIIIYFNCLLYSPYMMIPDNLFARFVEILYGTDK